MKKSINLTIIIVVIASFMAGMGAYQGILHIMNFETIQTAELLQKDNEIKVLNKRLQESNEIEKSVVIKKDDAGRYYCIACGSATIRGSQMIAFQKAKMDANIKLVEAIHGVQITTDSGMTTSKSMGTLKAVQEVERNIVNDSIAVVKLKIFIDEQE